MIKILRESNELVNIEKEIISKFGRQNPDTGNSYITPKGEFIQLYPEIDTHEDLCYWVEDNFDYEIEYEDEEWATREFSWIRTRVDPSVVIIELTSDYPTNAQWNALEEWLEFAEGDNDYRPTDIIIGVCDDSGNFFEDVLGEEMFAEDFIKICKKYYSNRSF